MREIKFRLWNNHAEEMAYKNFWINGSKMVYDDGKSYNDRELDNDLIVMQFTGLKDRNGKDIYEGDIVIAYNSVPVTPIKKQVVWREAKFIYEKDNKDFRTRTLASSDCEVIGNIYENPELL